MDSLEFDDITEDDLNILSPELRKLLTQKGAIQWTPEQLANIKKDLQQSVDKMKKYLEDHPDDEKN